MGYDGGGNVTTVTVPLGRGTTTSYTYDGTDVRVKKQTGAATSTYLWDRESGLPLLIDDGTNGYVHQGTGNPLTQTTLSGGTPKWLLTDALGSVWGAADEAGTLMGRANIDIILLLTPARPVSSYASENEECNHAAHDAPTVAHS